MDSQEKALLQQSTLEDPAKKAYATKQEVLERVKEIAHSSENPNKEELDLLKTTFYKIHLAERDAQMKEYLAKGGDPEKYILLPDDTEEAFKAEMQLIKEKRAKIFLAQEEENKIISAKRGNYRKDKGHDHLTGGGQQIISGLQGLAAGMEGNQEHPCRQGKRGMEELPALCRAVLRHAQVEQRSPRI